MQNKRQLNEISVMRPIVIVLLVMMHSFTMFQGGWSMPDGIEPIKAYFWVAAASYSFMLEAFVFISGYVLGFQLYDLNKVFNFKQLTISKLKRLIIPSIIFSAIYFAIFMTNKSHGIAETLYLILKGSGHMWFLPMLFWCFLATYAIEKIRIKDIYKLIFLFGLSCIPTSFLPFQMSGSCYYLFFFYLGIVIFKNRENILQHSKPRTLIVGALVFVLIFILHTLYKQYLAGVNSNGIMSLIFALSRKLGTLVYATLGLLVLYMTSLYLVEIRNIKISNNLNNFNKICFGIYLYQQFILQIMYYKTQLPHVLGSYALPVVGFVTALIVSASLAYFTRKTKVGRFLIG